MSLSYKPPKAVQNAAKQGLELRKKFGRGGLTPQEAGKAGIGSGIMRAVNLSKGDNIPLDTIKRMKSYFARHTVDKKAKNWGNNDNPSNGWIAWLLWGGDPGEKWANDIVKLEELRDSLRPLSKEAQEARKPLPPEMLIDALHDRIHKESEKARPANTVRRKQEMSETIIAEILADIDGDPDLEDVEAILLEALLEEEDQEKTGARSSWQRFRRYKSKSPKKWLCCSKPQLKRAKSGRRIWMVNCQYVERRGKRGTMSFVVGRNPRERPKEVTLKGKKMRTCRA